MTEAASPRKRAPANPVHADLLLRGGTLVNVYSAETYQTNVAIRQDRIVSIDPDADVVADETIDCTGLFIVPGFIDPHMHVDTTSLWPGELARVLVPLGTTTVIVDSTNVVTMGGPAMVRGLIEAFDGVPLRAFFAAPSYSPLEPTRETVGYELETDGLRELLELPGCLSIGETVSSKIRNEDPDYLERIAYALSRGARVSGHGGDLPRVGNEELFDAYVAAGVADDHCVMKSFDITQRLRRGLSLYTVESAGRENLSTGLLDFIRDEPVPTRHLHLCIDNITVMSMVAEQFGYLERSVRLGLEAGLPAAEVFRMASLNTAEHYRKAHLIGSVAPGRLADVLLLRALDEFPPEVVIVGGRVVAKRGELVIDIPEPRFSDLWRTSVYLHPSLSRERLALRVDPRATKATVRVMQVSDQDAAFNTCVTAELEVVDGVVQPDLDRDILKFCIVERYGKNGNVTVGLAQGFGLKRGALASTVSVPSNNIVAVGTSDEDIWFAIQRLASVQGGKIAVAEGQVLGEVLLPFGGVLSDRPYEEIVADTDTMFAAISRDLGGALARPFNPLVATVLCSLPDLGMTDRGLVDVKTGQFVPVVVGLEGAATPAASVGAAT